MHKEQKTKSPTPESK